MSRGGVFSVVLHENDHDVLVHGAPRPDGAKKIDTCTPQHMYDHLNSEFVFDYDPCPTDPTKDGLKTSWGKRSFVHPPWRSTQKWLEKAVVEMFAGNLSVFLVPARTNSEYWLKWVIPYAAEVRFVTGYPRFPTYHADIRDALCIIIYDPTEWMRRGGVTDTNVFTPRVVWGYKFPKNTGKVVLVAATVGDA